MLSVTGVLVFVGCLPLYHGITRNFLANSDMDIVLAYYAILVASELPLDKFPHTAYLHVLIYGAAIWIADMFGWITSSQIDVILKPNQFEQNFSEIVYAGRVLSILLAVASSAIVWSIAKILTENRWGALCALVLFAGSLGLGDQSSVIRTELPSMFFVLLGFWVLIIASRTVGWRAVIGVGFAAFFCYAAMLVKIQAVFLALFFPLLGLVLTDSRRDIFPPPEKSVLNLLVTASIAIIAPAAVGLFSQLPDDRYGLYQAVIMVYIWVAVLAYSRWTKIGNAWAIAGIAGLMIGLSVGEYLNLIKESWTGFAVFNFLEALSKWGGHSSTIDLILSLPGHFIAFVARYLVPQKEFTQTYPFLLVFWTAIFGLAAFCINRQWHAARTAGLLLFMAFALPTVFSIRGYLYHYRIYAEIWAILAALIFLAEFCKNKRHTVFAYAAMLFLCVAVSGVQIGYDQITPAAANTRNPEVVCGVMYLTRKFLPNLQPFCDEAMGKN